MALVESMIVPSTSNRIAPTVVVKGRPLKSYSKRRPGGEAVLEGVLKPESAILELEKVLYGLSDAAAGHGSELL